ncbi:hypothetical protein TTHERM_00522100 (macronuclear) [Tetrahymena thermophila SB210]|uniref:Uncharacterized protein n=1 Tax=Tetrahymena thermophila (strain SB210) TaxID=312017 RepID=I7MIQ0_TETTS|nr:hypothetical protein TTHERM_00522100 [Tetrahymena thermophila SB210]EAR94143.2 hypothetical protein TTHERM_00522100 [Tetrahymena thermophila SB210]|eukprot:XP_001014388.2 hypothetical protein TTHERM_00522100 [Tetrahymena thermophila SB210]
MKISNQTTFFAQIKQEEQQDQSQSQCWMNQGSHQLPKQAEKHTFSYKDSQSTTSLQSITAKVVLLNRSTSATNSDQCRNEDALYHYSHYINTFKYRTALLQEQEAKISYINNRKHQKLTYLPYQNLVFSVNKANIEKINDNFIFEWIRFMEDYDCEKIGLNITNQPQSNISNNIFNKNANFTFQSNLNNVINKSKKKIKLARKANHQINIRDLISQFSIPQDIQELILCKFCLYVQSLYKILKGNNREKQISSIDPQIYQFIFNNQINNDSIAPVNNEISQSGYLNSNHHEFNIFSKKQSQEDSSELLKQQKKYHFNMSKYFMLFLLELLSDYHIMTLSELPEAIITEISAIISEIKQISKKNNSSKTNYYNHYHYDVLFLQINEQTKNTVLKNQKLLDMHLKVFHIQNLDNFLSLQRINIIKQYISQIVLSQLSILKGKIFLSTQTSNLSKSVLEDLNSKIDYLYRVEQGIIDLNLGKTINRF